MWDTAGVRCQHITYIMGRRRDAQSCEGHRKKAQVKRGIVRQKDGVMRTEEFNEVGQDLFDGGLSPDHRVSNAVHLLDVRGNRDLRIDEPLEDGQLAAIESKAYRTDFDQPVRDREEAGGLCVEGHKSHIRETWLGVMHEPSILPLLASPSGGKRFLPFIGKVQRFGMVAADDAPGHVGVREHDSVGGAYGH
jgi:hypothetical protein